MLLRKRAEQKRELKELEKVQRDAEEYKMLKTLLQDAGDDELIQMADHHDRMAKEAEVDARGRNRGSLIQRSRSRRLTSKLGDPADAANAPPKKRPFMSILFGSESAGGSTGTLGRVDSDLSTASKAAQERGRSPISFAARMYNGLAAFRPRRLRSESPDPPSRSPPPPTPAQRRVTFGAAGAAAATSATASEDEEDAPAPEPEPAPGIIRDASKTLATAVSSLPGGQIALKATETAAATSVAATHAAVNNPLTENLGAVLGAGKDVFRDTGGIVAGPAKQVADTVARDAAACCQGLFVESSQAYASDSALVMQDQERLDMEMGVMREGLGNTGDGDNN